MQCETSPVQSDFTKIVRDLLHKFLIQGFAGNDQQLVGAHRQQVGSPQVQVAVITNDLAERRVHK